MRFIPSTIHGIFDYVLGILLITSATVFDFEGQWPVLVSIGLGVFTVVYSFVTAYEYGFLKLIPMRLHLVLDFAGGLFLAASPWIIGFAREVWIPQAAIGLFTIAVSLTSRPYPQIEAPGLPLRRL